MPRPRLGQHFLRSQAVLKAILEAADVRPGERVLEIGPGKGVLTRPLLDAVGPQGRIIAVELDAGLAKQLRIDAPDHLHILQGDAMDIEWGRVDRIVSNLPYSISGPVTAKLLGMLPWQRAVLLVQREFADRLSASPGSKDYGRLSVHVQRHCTVRRIRNVPPGCFDPPPRVDSAVLCLDPHPATAFAVPDEKLWRAVVDGPFQARRKQLQNTVPAAVAPFGLGKQQARAVLEVQGVASKRPEELAPEDFGHLVRALWESRP